MDNDAHVKLVKHRTRTTPLGCRVETVSTYDERTGLTSEDITLSHPLELVEVAIGHEIALDRLALRRR